jgi:hypothetical protein
MVFVWSRLVNGEPLFTLSQVALNDAIMVFAFAPLVALLLGISSIVVPWDTLLVSVVLYIVLPVLLAQVWRKLLLARGEPALQRTLEVLGPVSISALLMTLVLLFAFQGKAIVEQPLIIAMLAVPITIQVYFTSGLAYWLNRRVGEAHCVAGPSALIGASNFFELAVAAAISLFGFESGAALATVVGVLIEVPVMLSVVYLVKRSAGWYQSHHLMPAGFGFGAKLFEYGLQLFHLRAGKLRFQFGPAGGERQLAHAAVVCGGIHRDQFHFNQLPQGCVQRLFADTEQAEQGIDRNLRIAPDEIQDAVMHASQSALVEDAVRRRGEGAVAEIELLYG